MGLHFPRAKISADASAFDVEEVLLVFNTSRVQISPAAVWRNSRV
jgi:hypothetical protein